MVWWILVVSILFLLEISYIRLADRLNIIDKPNLRSSHTIPVVRGGGIIFPLAWLAMSAYTGWDHLWFTSGLMLLSLISFWDDMTPLSAGQRFIFHLISCALLMTELSVWSTFPVWGIIALFIVVIGILNAFNFMDGINGMTGMYALSFILPFIFHTAVPEGLRHINPVESPLIIVGASILVFGYFNFRKRARCFAGDVGSISIGFILIYFLLSFMTDQEMSLGLSHTGASTGFHLSYILMFSVYGVDTVLTILQRIILRENIFEAHRRHLYQFMANELGMSHLIVSTIYGASQLLINMYVLSDSFNWWGGAAILSILAVSHYLIKTKFVPRIASLN